MLGSSNCGGFLPAAPESGFSIPSPPYLASVFIPGAFLFTSNRKPEITVRKAAHQLLWGDKTLPGSTAVMRKCTQAVAGLLYLCVIIESWGRKSEFPELECPSVQVNGLVPALLEETCIDWPHWNQSPGLINYHSHFVISWRWRTAIDAITKCFVLNKSGIPT